MFYICTHIFLIFLTQQSLHVSRKTISMIFILEMKNTWSGEIEYSKAP